jgi:hypothetical protein
MRAPWIAIALAGVFLSSCSSLPDENAKLRKDIAVLRSQLLQSYRDCFEKYEYAKLDALAKQGYDWYWSLSWCESSGMGTGRERERIEKEHGKHGLAVWDEGWNAANEMHHTSCGHDPVLLKREVPNKAPATAEPAPGAVSSAHHGWRWA